MQKAAIILVCLCFLASGTLAAKKQATSGTVAWGDSNNVGAANYGTFANGSAAYIRAYDIINFDNHLLYGVGVRAVGGVANHTAGLAADALLFAISTEYDAAVAAAYFEAVAEATWSNATGNVTAGFSAAGIAAAVRFFKIIEYNDTNGQSGYQPGDQVLGWYHLAGPWNLPARWNNFTYEKIPVGTDSIIHRVTAVTFDGIFAFRASISGNYTSTGRYKIDPSTAKIDVLINGSLYYNNAINNNSYGRAQLQTQLPLLSHLLDYTSGPSSYAQSQLCLVAGVAGVAGTSSGGALSQQTSSVLADNSDLSNTSTFGASVSGKGYGVFFTHDQYANWTVSGAGVVGGNVGAAYIARYDSDTDPTAGVTGADASAALLQGVYANWKSIGVKALQFYSFTGAYRPGVVEWDPSMQVTGVNQGNPTTAPNSPPPPPPPPPGPPSSSSAATTAVTLCVVALIAALALLF